jgi:hypothetical protein
VYSESQAVTAIASQLNAETSKGHRVQVDKEALAYRISHVAYVPNTIIDNSTHADIPYKWNLNNCISQVCIPHNETAQ